MDDTLKQIIREHIATELVLIETRKALEAAQAQIADLEAQLAAAPKRRTPKPAPEA